MTAERFLLGRLGLFYDQVCEVEKDSFKRGQDHESKPLKRHFAGAVHEAVVADFHESAGQHMLEETPEKLEGVEGGFSGAIASGFAIGKGDLPVFNRNDAAVGNGHPEDVGGKILEGGLGIAHGLAVDIPGCLPDLGIDERQHGVFLHRRLEPGLEDLGQCPDRQVKSVACGQPLVPVC